MNLDAQKSRQFVHGMFSESIIPTLVEYIKIPNKSPSFDSNWQANGHMEKATRLIEDWCKKNAPKGMSVEIVTLPGRTPVIFMELAGSAPGNVLLYGHLDKQPEMTGWAEGLGPWTPVIKGDKLYGRGGADDGYAAFASICALRVLQDQGVALPRCVVLIEACEESGSFDLPFYVDKLASRIASPDLVVCLDSGCANYEQLWCTTSLRGLVGGSVTVKLLREGIHSGDGSGVAASTFRILRSLLDRIEDAKTGAILLPELSTEIPEQRRNQAKQVADAIGSQVWDRLPFVEGAGPMSQNSEELILNRTWRPFLAVTGAAGWPAPENAGNVLRPETTLKLSMRLPPTVDAEKAITAMKAALTQNPPYGAKVEFAHGEGNTGWNAAPLDAWLETSLMKASQEYFGKPAMYMGEGGSIPFIGMLGKKFPKAQFLITGVLGPNSNAHGPNEFLHIPTAESLTMVVASVIQDVTRQVKA